MAFYFENNDKEHEMTEKDENPYRGNITCQFSETRKLLVRLEIIVIPLVKTGLQHITIILLMSHRNKVLLYKLCITLLVIMIVIYFLKS